MQSNETIRGKSALRTQSNLNSINERVVAPWYDALTLPPERPGRMGSIPGRAPPFECHDKGSRTRLGLLYFFDPSAWR